MTEKKGLLERKTNEAPVPNIGTPGGSSLMVIFAVLCLTVFAILALTTVLADARLADAYADSVSDYYEASFRAEETIAQLRSGIIPENAEEENGIYSIYCPVSENETLTVRVRIENEEYEILSRTVAYTGDWNGNNSLDVWSGD